MGNVDKWHTKRTVLQIVTLIDPYKCNVNSYFKLSAIIIEYNITNYMQFVYSELQEVEGVVSIAMFDFRFFGHLRYLLYSLEMILQKNIKVKGITLIYEVNAHEPAMPSVILEPDYKVEAKICHCLPGKARILFYWCLSKELLWYFILE